MNQSRQYLLPSMSDFQGYESYDVDDNSNAQSFQHIYPDRSLFPVHYAQRKEAPDGGLDLSPLDDIAQKSAHNVPLQDVIKPQETGPWSGAQTAGNQSGQPFVSSWPLNTPYAKSEPPLRQDGYHGYTDSAYGTSITSHWDSRVYPGPSLADNDNDTRSVFSDGRLAANQRNGKRKHLLARCHCGKMPKNPSDARKHALTHEKPFCCHEQDCQRKEGFATQNDLQRHRKSVHKLIPSVGSRTGYICVACPPPDGNQCKFWPRRDNFKAHIKRKHPNYDMDQLLHMSKQTMHPEDAITVKTLGESIEPDSQIDPHEINHYGSEVNSGLSRHPSDQGGYQNVSWPSSATVNMPNDQLMEGMYGHLQFDQASMPHDAEEEDLSLLCHVTTEAPYNDDALSTSPFKRQKMNDHDDTGQCRSDHVHLHGLPAEFHIDSGSSGSTSAQSASYSATALGYECTKCHKKKRRDCDLKKHMKRHTRPYGCTFPSCFKRFGSRNDWKRHETSLHFLQEMWKCGQTCRDGKMCMRRPFRRQESLEKHLRGPDHDMKDTDEISQACKRFRLAREGHDHFWCGFCKKLVDQQQGVQTAWDERFKHIGDHFDKGGLEIGEWVCIEENIKKKYIKPSEVKERKRRVRAERTAEDLELDEYSPELTSTSTATQQKLLLAQDYARYAAVSSNKRKRENDMHVAHELYD